MVSLKQEHDQNQYTMLSLQANKTHIKGGRNAIIVITVPCEQD